MPRLKSLGFGVLAVVSIVPVAVAACGDDDDKNSGTSQFVDGGGDGTSPVPTTTGFQDTDAAPPPADASTPACVSQEAEAVPGKRPVDIIFAIDNSESMAEEISEVENQINENFAKIIESSGTDYRVIMLSRHGARTTPAPDALRRICVKAPLSGTNCDPPPAEPVDTAKFIHHNVTIDSQDALCKIITAINTVDLDGNHPQGFAPFLRPNAFKVITVITDDRPNVQCNGMNLDDTGTSIQVGETVAKTWDNYVLARYPQFGTAAKRNYVFHSIIGLKGYDPIDTSRPYPPEAPATLDKCSPGSEAPATGYQALSRLTSGLRFPTCGLNYTSMFQTMARAVVDRATIECDYAFPANPPGGKIDPSTAVVRYTSGNAQKDFTQAKDLTACQPGQFYIDAANDNRIKLCPDACNQVQGDGNAKVKVLFSCFPKDVQ